MLKIKRKVLGVVYQDVKFISELNVEDNILLPLIINNVPVYKKINYFDSLTESLNIVHIIKRYPDELSGGEKKKIAIARALINNPEILIADEPTANLDESSAKEVFTIFNNLNSLGLTIIIATHDERFGQYCKEIYFMEKGKIIRFSSKKH